MKHLQADIDSLFRPYLESYPRASLPKGKPYVPRMPLKLALSSQVWVVDAGREPILHYVGMDRFVPFSTPRKMKQPALGNNFGSSFSYYHYHIFYFRTRDEAYLHYYLNHSSPPLDEFYYLKFKYPEYLI